MASIDALINGDTSASKQLQPNADDDDELVSNFDALDVREDSEGWNDAEDDAEEIEMKCLLCDNVSRSAVDTLKHSCSEHDFDLAAIQKSHGR